MALVGSAVEGVTSYAFTVPSIMTATLCTPSQLPSTGARVPAMAVAAGFSPVAVKTMDVPSAPSGRKPASSCVQAYKYKDKIFEYSEQGDDTTTINAKLQDNAGVLSSVMNELYLAGANILAVNQSKQNKKEFLRGYDYMLSKIEPEAVIDGVNLLPESIRQTTPVTCFRFDNCFYYIRFLLFLQSPYMIF